MNQCDTSLVELSAIVKKYIIISPYACVLSKSGKDQFSVDAEIFLNCLAKSGKLYICMNKMGNIV